VSGRIVRIEGGSRLLCGTAFVARVARAVAEIDVALDVGEIFRRVGNDPFRFGIEVRRPDFGILSWIGCVLRVISRPPWLAFTRLKAAQTSRFGISNGFASIGRAMENQAAP
jgi:hypothetical protein